MTSPDYKWTGYQKSWAGDKDRRQLTDANMPFVLAAESREALMTRLSEAEESIKVAFPSVVENFHCTSAKVLDAALML